MNERSDVNSNEDLNEDSEGTQNRILSAHIVEESELEAEARRLLNGASDEIGEMKESFVRHPSVDIGGQPELSKTLEEHSSPNI